MTSADSATNARCPLPHVLKEYDPMDHAKLAEIQRNVDRFASAMDDWIRIPGTKIRLGWDPILGLIPGIGDVVTFVVQFYVVASALRVGVRKRVFLMMLLNTLIDSLVGAIPVLGDVFDVFWKSNRKNAELLRREIARVGRRLG